MANVAMILFEEHDGIYATHHFAMVLGANLPWGLLPIAVIVRMAREHPFTIPRDFGTESAVAGVATEAEATA